MKTPDASGTKDPARVDPEDVCDQRAGEDTGRRSVGGDTAAGHHDQPVCIIGGEIEIVQDRQPPAPRRDMLAGDVEDLELVADIEAGGRLVAEQPVRRAIQNRRPELAEHTGKLDTLLLAA